MAPGVSQTYQKWRCSCKSSFISEYDEKR